MQSFVKTSGPQLALMNMDTELGASDADTETSNRPKKRRRRCARACERCKSRKQKCDGQEPCSNCVHYKAHCVFEILPSPKPDSVTMSYIAALEERCAQLESALIQAEPTHEAVQDHLDRTSNAVPGGQRTASTSLVQNGPSARSGERGLRGGRLVRPAAVEKEQNVQEIESTICDYLHDLSTKAVAEMPYVGDHFGLTFAQLAKASVRHGMHVSPAPFRQYKKSSDSRSLVAPNMPSLPDSIRARELVDAAYMHVQSRYPFMQWRPSPEVADDDRAHIPSIVSQLARYAGLYMWRRPGLNTAFFIWMMYAVGSTYTHQISNEQHARTSAKAYFAAASAYMDHVLERHDMVTVQALALVAMYSFRAEDGPSVWHLVGLAMRICVEKGMHRKPQEASVQADPCAAEVSCRVFWSIYTLDRLVSITLGRPMAIGDEDIDADEPLDIDCHLTEGDAVLSARHQRDLQRRNPTSMSSACHWIRLFRIRSCIIRRLKEAPVHEDDLHNIIAQLDHWKGDLARIQDASGRGLPALTHDRLLKGYYMAISLLLRPRMTRPLARNDIFLRQLSEASAQCCELENKIISSEAPAHSMAALYSSFTSGLTLLQTLAIQHDIIPYRQSSRGVRACTSVLVAYATLFPEAQSFRVAFEELVDSMEDDHAEPARFSAAPPQTPGSSRLNHGLDPPKSPPTVPVPARNTVPMPAWQDRLFDIESRLQCDLHQDMAGLAAILGLGSLQASDSGLDVLPTAPSQGFTFTEEDLFDIAAYTSLGDR